MAEKRTIELEVNSNLGSLKQQLKEAKAAVLSLSEEFGHTSLEASNAASKAAELKLQISEGNKLIKAFNPAESLNSATTAMGGVNESIGLVGTSFKLLGTESEGAAVAMEKVGLAMEFTGGISSIQESVKSFETLGAVVTNFGSKAVASFRAMTAANKVFMITGIGVLLVALGAVVAYWDDISNALGFTTKESEKYAQQQKLITEQAKEQRAEIAKESGAFTQQILRLKATNAESKERKKLINEVNKTYGTTFTNLKDEAKFQAALNVELASYLEYQKAKYQLQKNEKAIVANLEKQDELTKKLYDSQQKIDKARKDGAGKQKRTLEEGIITYVNVNEAADKSLESTQKVISQTQIELDKAKGRFNNYGKAANDAQAAIDKLTNGGKKFVEGSDKTNDKVKDNVDKIKGTNDDLVAYYDAIEQDRQSKITDAKEKEQQELANKYEALYLLAEKAGISTLDLQKQHGAESSLIRKKYDDLEREAIAEKTAKEKERIANEKAFLDSITLSEYELKLQKLEEQYLADIILYKDNKEILAALDIKYQKDKEALNKDTNDKIADSDEDAAKKKQDLLNSQLDAVKQGLYCKHSRTIRG